MSRLKEVLKKAIPFLAKYKYVAIIILAGIILISLPDFGSSDKKTSTETDRTETEYSAQDLERRLEEALSKSSGVGRVYVTLALKSGTETIYAKDNKNSVRNGGSPGEVTQDRQTEEKIVVVPAGSGTQEALAIKKILPEFRGAVIVCDGADSATVQLYITDAVSSLTGLSSEKITVIKMKE